MTINIMKLLSRFVAKHEMYDKKMTVNIMKLLSRFVAKHEIYDKKMAIYVMNFFIIIWWFRKYFRSLMGRFLRFAIFGKEYGLLYWNERDFFLTIKSDKEERKKCISNPKGTKPYSSHSRIYEIFFLRLFAECFSLKHFFRRRQYSKVDDIEQKSSFFFFIFKISKILKLFR